MLKTAHIALGLAFVLSMSSEALAKSQQQPSAQTSQQETKQEDRGSEKSPIVVKVLPTEKSKDDLAREEAKDQADRRLIELTGDLAGYTKFLFFATAILAFITGGLLFVGYRQIRDARESIAAATKSANIAERALTELEAPTIFVKIIEPGLRAVPGSFDSR